MLWDIFCRVIDNHGDIGICWRLARNLAARGESVRLWLDDPSALAWMAPGGCAGVQVGGWNRASRFPPPGEVVIEAFGCELPQAIIADMKSRSKPPRWINLEYLTAEHYAARSHRLPSPVLHGQGTGLVKHFFYPGFTHATGGLLHEPDLLQRQLRFDRAAWLGSMGIPCGNGAVISLFCYEPPALPDLLGQLDRAAEPTRLLVTAGRATQAVKACLQGVARAASMLSISYHPLLAQDDYDHLLWSCNFNVVRGEDSLVRALLAGRPFAWQVYPQHDDAHHGKLMAFLDWLQAPSSLREFHIGWNGFAPTLPPLDLPAWEPCVQAARSCVLGQDDLATQLLRFVCQAA